MLVKLCARWLAGQAMACHDLISDSRQKNMAHGMTALSCPDSQLRDSSTINTG